MSVSPDQAFAELLSRVAIVSDAHRRWPKHGQIVERMSAPVRGALSELRSSDPVLTKPHWTFKYFWDWDGDLPTGRLGRMS